MVSTYWRAIGCLAIAYISGAAAAEAGAPAVAPTSTAGTAWARTAANRPGAAWTKYATGESSGVPVQLTQWGARRGMAADADDGAPNNIFRPPVRPQNNPEYPRPDVGRQVLEGIVAPLLIEALKPRPQPNPQWPQQDNRPPFRPQPRPSYRPPQVQPQRVPQAVVTPAAPKAVVKNVAPEMTKPVKKNFEPVGLGLVGMDEESLKLTSEVVQKDALEKHEELTEKIGPLAMDPTVKEKLDAIEQDIKDGKAVPQEKIDELKAAITEASKNTGVIPGIAPDKFDELAGKLQESSQANELLAQALADANNNNGGQPIFPQGPTDVIVIPALSEDDLTVLPDGTIVTGGGGQGEISVDQIDGQELVDAAIGVGDPVPDASGDVAKRVKSGVLLTTSKDVAEDVNYDVNGKSYTLKPGYTQTLPAGQKWLVRFDRGDGEETKYTLKDGSYAFGASEKGWELFARTFNVSIDNSGNENSFFYNIDNTQVEAKPGEVKKHTSTYPILVRFDRGDGGKEAQKKVLDGAAKLVVAINPETSLWDLFPADEQPQTQLARADEPKEASSKTDKKAVSRAAKLRALLRQTTLRD